jgi:hypothetical protein
MRLVGSFAIAFLLIPHAAEAASWSMFNFATTPQDSAKVVAAADKLMSSKVGKEFPGKVLLQVFTANGADPSTHTFVPIYKNAGERETFVQKMQADPAWTAFQASMAGASQPVSQVLYRTVKSWGEIVDSDNVWIAHAFQVSDPAAFLKAIDTLMASPTGKKFPGQVYLSGVVAGGLSPVSHVISVGYASEAEMESWIAVRDASTDWSTYLTASRKSADYLGANLARTLKSWGPATLKEITVP